MKFGILKSKIEAHLLESYQSGNFKTELKNFQNLVLKNKNINKIYYLYEELNSNKGLNESEVDDFIFESIRLYENSINKIIPKDIEKIQNWVANVKTENAYVDIDNLFSLGVLNLESKIKSKKNIVESLKKKKEETKAINIPISSMISIANKTLNEHLDTLDSESRKEFLDVISTDNTELEKKYQTIKEEVLNKLSKLKTESADNEVSEKIEETIQRVVSENFDKFNFVKLKKLNENL